MIILAFIGFLLLLLLGVVALFYAVGIIWFSLAFNIPPILGVILLVGGCLVTYAAFKLAPFHITMSVLP